MEANRPKAAARMAGRLVVLLVGLVWAAAAIGKVVTPADDQAWISEFPQWVVTGVTLSEAVAAGLIFAGRARIGLALDMVLVLSFLGALLISPPDAGQSCGCAGAAVVSTSPADLAAHLFAFAGLHLLAVVSLPHGLPEPERSRAYFAPAAD